VVEVAELGGFEPADLVAVVGMVAGVVPERDLPPRQPFDLGIQARMFFLTTARLWAPRLLR
jgi:hypothetical protein